MFRARARSREHQSVESSRRSVGGSKLIGSAQDEPKPQRPFFLSQEARLVADQSDRFEDRRIRKGFRGAARHCRIGVSGQAAGSSQRLQRKAARSCEYAWGRVVAIGLVPLTEM